MVMTHQFTVRRQDGIVPSLDTSCVVCGVRYRHHPKRDMEELIDASSLGTPGAKALRDTVPVEVAAEVVRRSMEPTPLATDEQIAEWKRISWKVIQVENVSDSMLSQPELEVFEHFDTILDAIVAERKKTAELKARMGAVRKAAHHWLLAGDRERILSALDDQVVG